MELRTAEDGKKQERGTPPAKTFDLMVGPSRVLLLLGQKSPAEENQV